MKPVSTASRKLNQPLPLSPLGDCDCHLPLEFELERRRQELLTELLSSIRDSQGLLDVLKQVITSPDLEQVVAGCRASVSELLAKVSAMDDLKISRRRKRLVARLSLKGSRKSNAG